jgi:hypothetical protein
VECGDPVRGDIEQVAHRQLAEQHRAGLVEPLTSDKRRSDAHRVVARTASRSSAASNATSKITAELPGLEEKNVEANSGPAGAALAAHQAKNAGTPTLNTGQGLVGSSSRDACQTNFDKRRDIPYLRINPARRVSYGSYRRRGGAPVSVLRIKVGRQTPHG